MANGYAVYFNPAALGGTKGTTITGDVSILLRFARYNRTADALSPSNPDYVNDPQYVKANTGVANLTNVLAIPYIGVNTDFGTENLRGGYAAYIPFGGMATWDRRSGDPTMPGTVDGVSRWHNISGQLLEIYNTFALAYRIKPANLTIGASVSPIIQTVGTVRARNVDGSDDVLSAGQLVEGRSYVSATGLTVGIAAGLYWEPTPEVRLGVSYTSQPGFGETRTSGTLRTQLGANAPEKQDIDFIQAFPDIVRLGAAWRVSPKWEVRADGEFVRWNTFKRQCVVARGADCNVADDGRDLSGGAVILNVPRNWDNAFGVRVGPAWWASEKTEVFGSLGLTTPAVPKETIDPSTIDSTRLYFTAGVKYEFNKHFALAGSYNHIYFFDVDTKGRNIQNLPDHPANMGDGGQYNASRSPSADGKYTSQIGMFNLNAAYTF